MYFERRPNSLGGCYINNLKLWYSADQQFDSTDIQLGSAMITIPAVAGSVSFNNFQQKIGKNSTGYLLLITDIASNATDGDIIYIAAPDPLSNITFDSGTKSGTLGASGNLTIDAKPPVGNIPSLIPNPRNTAGLFHSNKIINRQNLPSSHLRPSVTDKKPKIR